jgi:plastocyanin
MIARHHSLLPLALLLVGLAASACSDRDEPTEPVVDSGDVTEVVISDFAFSAPTITIDRGETVRWRNATRTVHTVTPNGHQAFAARQTSAQGQTFETRFDTPGRYLYYCEPHRSLGMTGEVVVR